MLWSIDSCQKGYLLISVTNEQKQGEKGEETKTNKRETKIKVEEEESLIINQN